MILGWFLPENPLKNGINLLFFISFRLEEDNSGTTGPTEMVYLSIPVERDKEYNWIVLKVIILSNYGLNK